MKNLLNFTSKHQKAQAHAFNARVSEDTIGELIYYYELLTSLVGELIDVNTYDQPGVEAGKIILKEKLRNASTHIKSSVNKMLLLSYAIRKR